MRRIPEKRVNKFFLGGYKGHLFFMILIPYYESIEGRDLPLRKERIALMKQFNLQLFAEEAGAASAEVSPTAGDTAGSTEGTEQSATAPSFDELIESNPEYKQAYEGHLKEHISKRFKNQKDNQAEIDRLTPFVAMVAQKYGIESKDGKYDIEAVTKAISDDNSMYEEEAFKRGMNVEDYKHMRQMEIENENLRRINQQRDADEQSRQEFNALMEEAENLKNNLYPNLDLGVEMENPQFGRLLAAGVPLKTAYEVVHNEEIIAGGMKYAVEKTKENLSKSIQAGSTRVMENGISAQSASDPGRVNISKLSSEEIASYIARAKNGEQITFR